MRTAICVLLALAFIPAAWANTQVTWVKDAAPNGMDRYLVTITTNTFAGQYAAVDVAFTGTINNIGHAVYLDEAAGLGADAGNDSHFMQSTADVLVIIPASIDTSTKLAGAFGLPLITDMQTPTLQLAQIVVPHGMTFDVDGNADVRVADTHNVERVTYSAVVPEPGTATLLVLGTWGLLSRRRSRAA